MNGPGFVSIFVRAAFSRENSAAARERGPNHPIALQIFAFSLQPGRAFCASVVLQGGVCGKLKNRRRFHTLPFGRHVIWYLLLSVSRLRLARFHAIHLAADLDCYGLGLAQVLIELGALLAGQIEIRVAKLNENRALGFVIGSDR
jgi:hypothetical protein